MSLEQTRKLVQALKNPTLYPHSVTDIDIIETHISWVLLTGPFVYKIKKPLDLGFVDFSTLEKRREYCFEEISLNQRLAPQIYLNVISISGTPDHPRLGLEDSPLEFAVKMRQFKPDATLDHIVSHGRLKPHHLDQLGWDLARFHKSITIAPSGSDFGNIEMIKKNFQEIFKHLREELTIPLDLEALDSIQFWLEQQQANHVSVFISRKDEGYIRECHGDLHLSNLVLIEDHVIPFDGIEFSKRLRWIDVMNDIAFAVMDLSARSDPWMGMYLLNRYLEATGDYGGLRVLRFYQVYRALVRTKVAALRMTQAHSYGQISQLYSGEFDRYLRVAKKLMEPCSPGLIISHGLSGSGKTFISQLLLQSWSAIRIRSDVERKRLFGLGQDVPGVLDIKSEFYSAAATEMTYNQLLKLARIILISGFSVVVDATFLKRRYRDMFRLLAKEEQVPFLILNVQASPETLQQRIVAREIHRRDISEADLCVLKQQQLHQEPLEKDEQAEALVVNSEEPFDPNPILVSLRLQSNS